MSKDFDSLADFREMATPLVACRIASAGWPHLVGQNPMAEPLTRGRFSDAPLWRLANTEHRFALRGWPPERIDQARSSHRIVQQTAQRIGLPLPTPLVSPVTNSRLYHAEGLAWELTPWLNGTPLAGEPNLEQLQSAAAALAELHEATRDLGGESKFDPIGQYRQRLERLQGELAGGLLADCRLHEWTACWSAEWPDATSALLAGTKQALEQLQAADRSPPSTQWIWGDAWHGNYLFHDNRVVALLDFAAVRVDTPLADIARLLGAATRCGSVAWQAGLDAYDPSNQLSPQERQLVSALHACGTVLSLGNWLCWLSVQRRRFPDPLAARGRLDHFAQRLAEYLQLATMPL